jgi:LysM repeat protein
MLDRRSKISIACGFLMGATGLAMFFRQEPTGGVPSLPATFDRLVLPEREESRIPTGPALVGPNAPAPPPVLRPMPPPDASAGPVSAPMPSVPPPPELPQRYPGQPRSAWGTSIALGLLRAGPSAEPMTRHKIHDGDTLPALAQRFLGTAERAGEIFQANRDVLNRPDLLPIGLELKIPPRESPVTTMPGPQRRLVPLPPRGQSG